MGDSYFMRQCNLEKQLPGGGKKCTVSWIPEKFAVKGKILELSGEDGWEVVGVGDKRRTNGDVHEHSRDGERWRDRIDD